MQSPGEPSHLNRAGEWFLTALLMLVGLSSGVAAEELVTLNQLRNLTPKQAAEGPQVRIKGIVLCFDSGWHQLYLHDGYEALYFNADDFATQPAFAQSVEITGRARGTNVLENANLRALGPGQLPAAKRLELGELGSAHGQWIETSGQVLSADTSRGRLGLLLQQNGHNCLAYVLGGAIPSQFDHWIGSRVRLRGINASKTGPAGLESPMVFVPGTNEVTILEPASASVPFIPVTSIGSLLTRELGPWTNQRVHLNGLVVSYQPGQTLVVRDPTGAIRARVIQLNEMRADERVDVWGFLQTGPDGPELGKAYFEVAHAVNSPLPQPAQASPPHSSKVLTEVSDILKLPRDVAAQRLPVRLRGIVTYADPEWRNGFIQDKGDAIYVDLDPTQTGIQPGQCVELMGVTSPGGFAPEVLSTAVQVLGTTNLPAPARVDLEDLANGHLDAHWVEMEGVVRRVDVQAGHANLSVMTAKGRFNVIMPGFANRPLPTHLIDALVSIQGACTSELNVRRQLSGITLHVPNVEQIRILEAPSADPFAIDATPVGNVATFVPGQLAGRRIKLQGVVTLKLAGQGFILQDRSGGLRVLTRQTNDVPVGSLVDVLGFPAIGDFSPCLEEAVFRQTGLAALPDPRQISAEQILLYGSNDAQVVELKARLLQSVPRSASPQLVLQDGPIIFTAALEGQSSGAGVAALQSGSLVRLTGVCAIQGGLRHEPAAFRLLLRRSEDIAVLQKPPWWTSRHTFMLAGGLTLGILAALGWVASLRRQVRAQTQLVRQKLENEAALEARFRDLFENANDMVYTHDREGRITAMNQSGERLLQTPRVAILSRNILDFIVDEQRATARQWLDSVVKEPSLAPTEWDFVTASGQRLKLEISTRLIEHSGRVLEVEGIARDITERKRLEREILEISNREQRRIGHDLHDGVCQQLAGIAFMTSTLADELEEKGVPESAEVDKISGMINEVIGQTRGVARGLFPVRLEEHGLVVALEELAANASDLFKLTCRFTCQNPPAAVDNVVALHLYYIVLEAVANASKHGGAGIVLIGLEPRGDRYLLTIRDDGCGFSPSAKSQVGMGLRIMHYRARVIGATLNVQSRPGQGTTITCVFLPVSREGMLVAEPSKTAARVEAKTLN